MDFDKIQKLMELLEKGNLSKIHVKEKDFEICLEKQNSNNAYYHPDQIHSKEIHSNKETSKKENAHDEIYINSPMVGTFYESPSPDKACFIKVGDLVEKDSVVCIIEAMKVMNEVRAGEKGVIEKILIENAHPVEYGTKLFKIIPQ
jgi:acetyl-CoA carboxylase biotin carboxyl carrier protein